MKTLLSVLRTVPEYQGLLDCLSHGEVAAITGIGQINRSHMIAGLRQDTAAPMVVIFPEES